jgi:uncharacterized protein
MQELLEILRCPETQQPFQIADPALVANLNSQIKSGQVKNRIGKPISDPIESALIRQDRKFLYPIRNNIPVLLIDEAIPL